LSDSSQSDARGSWCSSSARVGTCSLLAVWPGDRSWHLSVVSCAMVEFVSVGSRCALWTSYETSVFHEIFERLRSAHPRQRNSCSHALSQPLWECHCAVGLWCLCSGVTVRMASHWPQHGEPSTRQTPCTIRQWKGPGIVTVLDSLLRSSAHSQYCERCGLCVPPRRRDFGRSAFSAHNALVSYA